jgi:hypothetical protein
MNSENTLSIIDVRKVGKIVRSHKFPIEVCVVNGCAYGCGFGCAVMFVGGHIRFW